MVMQAVPRALSLTEQTPLSSMLNIDISTSNPLSTSTPLILILGGFGSVGEV